MKINIEGFEVSINAKGIYGENYNKRDTMALLNTISIWAAEAAEYYKILGSGLADTTEDASHRIYKRLEAEGLYKDL